jgi:O-antigen/teichoic acid export membrane protein
MAASSVISGVIVARVLGAEKFGAYADLSVAATVTVLIGSLGLPAANTYFVAKNKALAGSVAVNSILLASISGGVFATVLWGLAVLFPAVIGNLPGNLVAIAVLAVPFQLATALGLSVFLALGRMREFNAIDLLGQLFIIANAVIALWLLQSDLWFLFALNSAAAVFCTLITFALLFRLLAKDSEEFRGRWRVDIQRLGEMVLYALKGQVLWVATLLMLRLDLLIVSLWRGSEEAGVYAVATQFTLLILLLPTAVSHLLLARVAETRGAAADLTCRAARYISALILLACLASVPLSYLVPIVYGPAFAGTPSLLILLLPGVFFMSLQTALLQYFVGTGLPRLVPLSWAFALAINIILNCIIVPHWGASGAAVVSTFSYMLIFVLIFLLFRAETDKSWRDILILRNEELSDLLHFRLGPLDSGHKISQ